MRHAALILLLLSAVVGCQSDNRRATTPENKKNSGIKTVSSAEEFRTILEEIAKSNDSEKIKSKIKILLSADGRVAHEVLTEVFTKEAPQGQLWLAALNISSMRKDVVTFDNASSLGIVFKNAFENEKDKARKIFIARCLCQMNVSKETCLNYLLSSYVENAPKDQAFYPSAAALGTLALEGEHSAGRCIVINLNKIIDAKRLAFAGKIIADYYRKYPLVVAKILSLEKNANPFVVGTLIKEDLARTNETRHYVELMTSSLNDARVDADTREILKGLIGIFNMDNKTTDSRKNTIR